MINQFETNVRILELTKKSVEEFREKYTTERKLEFHESSILEQQKLIEELDEYKKKEQMFEEQIKDLC